MERRQIYQAYLSGPKLIERSTSKGTLVLDNWNGLVIETTADSINAHLKPEVTAASGMILRSFVEPEMATYGVVGDYENIDLHEYSGIETPSNEERRGWYLGTSGWKIAQLVIENDDDGDAGIHLLCLNEEISDKSNLDTADGIAEVTEYFANMWDVSDNNRYLFEVDSETAYIIDVISQLVNEEDGTSDRLTTVRITEIVEGAKTGEFVHIFSTSHPERPLIWDIYVYEARN